MVLPSVVSKTLGKHGTLPSVPRKTLGKPKNYFLKKCLCRVWHSANTCQDTRQTVIFRQVGHDSYFCLPSVKRTLEKRHAVIFLPSPLCRVWHSANGLPSVFCRLPGVLDTRQSVRFSSACMVNIRSTGFPKKKDLRNETLYSCGNMLDLWMTTLDSTS